MAGGAAECTPPQRGRQLSRALHRQLGGPAPGSGGAKTSAVPLGRKCSTNRAHRRWRAGRRREAGVSLQQRSENAHTQRFDTSTRSRGLCRRDVRAFRHASSTEFIACSSRTSSYKSRTGRGLMHILHGSSPHSRRYPRRCWLYAGLATQSLRTSLRRNTSHATIFPNRKNGSPVSISASRRRAAPSAHGETAAVWMPRQ